MGGGGCSCRDMGGATNSEKLPVYEGVPRRDMLEDGGLVCWPWSVLLIRWVVVVVAPVPRYRLAKRLAVALRMEMSSERKGVGSS